MADSGIGRQQQETEQLRFPKKSGPPSDRQRKAARYRRLRQVTRAEAWRLDEGRCVWPTCGKWMPLADAHEHETVWRGHGGDPCDVDNVVTTCADCHADIHPRIGGVRKRIEGGRAEGLRFYERHGETWQEVTT